MCNQPALNPLENKHKQKNRNDELEHNVTSNQTKMVKAMADENAVRSPWAYFPDPTVGRPVFNGYVYVGEPDTDPQITTNQIQVKAVQEDGSTVNIAQPIRTGAGGVPMLNGSPVQLITEGEHSLKVLNKDRAQVYYASSIVGGDRPTTIINTVPVPLSTGLPDRLINNTLFATNTSFTDYYNSHKPVLDLGAIGTAPFIIENIPSQRFDLAEGNSVTDLGVLP